MKDPNIHKFTVGDLVELSAKGKKVKSNRYVLDLVGLVVDIKPVRQHPITVDWISANVHYNRYNPTHLPMRSYEIKKVRGAICK